jgi:hypothetical protein
MGIIEIIGILVGTGLIILLGIFLFKTIVRLSVVIVDAIDDDTTEQYYREEALYKRYKRLMERRENGTDK